MENQIVALEHNSLHKNRKRRKKFKCSQIRIVNQVNDQKIMKKKKN